MLFGDKKRSSCTAEPFSDFIMSTPELSPTNIWRHFISWTDCTYSSLSAVVHMASSARNRKAALLQSDVAIYEVLLKAWQPCILHNAAHECTITSSENTAQIGASEATSFFFSPPALLAARATKEGRSPGGTFAKNVIEHCTSLFLCYPFCILCLTLFVMEQTFVSISLQCQDLTVKVGTRGF